MKYLFLAPLLLNTLFIHVFSQEHPDTVYADEEIVIYEFTDSSAVFPGGAEEMYKFLGENIRYPQDVQDQGIQGRVYVKFAVMKDGSIQFVQIFKSAHELLDNEAMRVVKLMPKWTPGEKDGKKVNTWFTLPISFKIAENNKSRKKSKKKNGKR